MKTFFLLFVAETLSFNAISQTWIKVEEAAKHKGQVINLVGLVSHVQHVKDRQRYITLTGLGGKNSNHSLTLIVKDPVYPTGEETLDTSYLNQYVQVSGRIKMYKGKPQIVISKENQILITREPRKQDDWEPF